MNSQREAFEKVFPVPEGCFWNGECYLSHNVHNYNDMRDANDQNMRLEVWQAATEQDVGEAVYQWREIGETDWMDCSKEWKEKCDESPEHDARTLYTHPPKPTGGGVPDREAIIQCLFDNLNNTQGKTADAILALLATQQPPEQE